MHVAAVRLDDVPRDIEPQSRAFGLELYRVITAKELAEKFLDLVRGDPNTGILHADLHVRLVRQKFRRDGHLSVFYIIPYRVIEKICDHERELRGNSALRTRCAGRVSRRIR